MPDHSVDQGLVQFGEGSLTFLETRLWKVISFWKGLAISPAPCYFVFRSGSLQRDPAAAAKAGFPTFTLICFGFASSRFGMLSVSTPF